MPERSDNYGDLTPHHRRENTISNNKKLLIKQFEENCGQFVIMGNDVVRFIGIAEDDMDYYYVTYDGRKINWHSAVGSYTVLKGKIDEKDYNHLIHVAKLNHFDQDDFFSPSTEEEKEKRKLFAISHKLEISKVSGYDKYIVPLHWELN